MTLPEYVYYHLIDLDLMSKSELTDLINHASDELDISLDYFQDNSMIDLISDLEDHLYSDDVTWITKYKYHNS